MQRGQCSATEPSAVVFKTGDYPEVILLANGDHVSLSLSYMHRNQLFDSPDGNLGLNVAREHSDCH